MNTKQKMIEAMRKAQVETTVFRDGVDRTTPAMLDAALAVLEAEYVNDDELMEILDGEKSISLSMGLNIYPSTFIDPLFHHIRNQEPKP